MAQFRVEVSGIGLSQLPIAIVQFRGEHQSPQKISAIVRADLERSGQFRGIETQEKDFDESTRPDFSSWRQSGADALVAGSVVKTRNGRYAVRFRLWDVPEGQDMGGQSYEVTEADLRLASHRVADFVFEALTQNKGIFATRIAYVTKQNNVYNLWIADADGENSQSALTSPSSIISPAWSPDGTHVAYVSFESRKPVVYTHEVSTGRRRLLANFRGSNSAPAWSPDGRSLAVTLTQDGESQIYLLDTVGNGQPRRLTKSSSIDTEPVFSPDGSSLYFVSDRDGSPQIYCMPIQTGIAERITFEGNYNISPTISADARWMAYVSRVNGSFKLYVLDFSTGKVNAITATLADEHPSFSPNGKQIIYATELDGRHALMTTTLDGATRAKLTGNSGDIREPSWGPFINIHKS
ncbi:MAG: Tol-Pal system beta propeller repeat protein TolB [Rhodoferax sp.]|uniref:Tol-Pal system beta propeller repeat protein TolB n=1 Tax=Rhodoferax sp. TaxID=50421 RepID=UPI002606B7DF|nr:Tol-Pal system beta propeller repeat protein TolB [Rhodoferax sp.]MDD5334138.1 Tol-Pal system beta propeller repeat protein TolB [Rhodoferax sp.]